MPDKQSNTDACRLCGSRRNAVYYRRSANDCILKCLQCGLLFVFPRPPAQELEEYYRTSDPAYIQGYQDQISRRGRQILSRAQELKKPGLLLDLGCGYGYFMAQAEKNGWQVAGVELSPAAARFARERFRLDVFAGDMAEAALQEKSFDLISLQHVLEHIPEPLELLTALRGKLKDDGLLAIAVPNAASLTAKWAGINWAGLDEATHLFHYTIPTLRKLLEKTGFIPVSMETFQWDARTLLWSFKMLITGRKRPGTPQDALRLHPGQASAPDRTAGPCKKFICNAARPLCWLASRAGLGAEIIALAKKNHTWFYDGLP